MIPIQFSIRHCKDHVICSYFRFIVKPPQELVFMSTDFILCLQKTSKPRGAECWKFIDATPVMCPLHVPSLYLFPYHLQVKKMIFTFWSQVVQPFSFVRVTDLCLSPANPFSRVFNSFLVCPELCLYPIHRQSVRVITSLHPLPTAGAL